jgi:hypothetical protein
MQYLAYIQGKILDTVGYPIPYASLHPFANSCHKQGARKLCNKSASRSRLSERQNTRRSRQKNLICLSGLPLTSQIAPPDSTWRGLHSLTLSGETCDSPLKNDLRHNMLIYAVKADLTFFLPPPLSPMQRLRGNA